VPNDDQAQSQDLTVPAQPEKVIAAKAVIPTPTVATDDQVAMTETGTTKKRSLLRHQPVPHQQNPWKLQQRLLRYANQPRRQPMWLAPFYQATLLKHR
jgi:hypothetical protein